MNIGKGVRAERSRVAGWRAWTVIETNDGIRLASVIYDTIWHPARPTIAACRCGEAHVAPALDCTCGFHAARDPVDALTYLHGRDEPRTICRVLGEVLLSRLVVETEAGYRGELANPLRLYVNNAEVAAELETSYRVPVLSLGCESASATTSTAASAGSSTSSCGAARTPWSWTVVSG
ncbi:MAG: hypothetical protein V7645_2616 [Actinomycetota bacterium]|jgi:hypothetical protein